MTTSEAAPVSRPRRRMSLAVRWIVTLGLLALVAVHIDLQQLAGMLSQINWGWALLAALGALTDRVVATVRWFLLLRVKQFTISFVSLLNLHFAANFIGGFLPTSFGADAARIVMLSRQSSRTLDTVAASAVDRLVMILTTLVAAAVVCLVIVGARVPVALQHAVLVVAAVCAVAAVVVYLLCAFGSMLRLLKVIAGERVYSKVALLYWSMHEYRNQKGTVLISGVLSAFILVLRATVLLWMALAFGVDVAFLECLVIWPIAAVIMMLPVSVGNFGLQEGTYIALLGTVGVTATAAVSISLLDHLLARLVVLPGALVWLLLPSFRAKDQGDMLTVHAVEGSYGERNAAQ